MEIGVGRCRGLLRLGVRIGGFWIVVVVFGRNLIFLAGLRLGSEVRIEGEREFMVIYLYLSKRDRVLTGRSNSVNSKEIERSFNFS